MQFTTAFALIFTLAFTQAALGPSLAHHRLGRVPHVLSPSPTSRSLASHRYRSGQNVPLNGNVLSLGYYFLNITVNAVPLSLLFDTGSSNLAFSAAAAQKIAASPVLFDSATCSACNPAAGTCLFGAPEPAIGHPELCGMSVSYGGGSSYIQGYLTHADVHLDGMVATNASVIAITRELPVGAFSLSPSDGIIGFASEVNSVNPSYAPTLWGQLSHTYRLSSEFGLCLNSTAGGVLTLGGYDRSKFRGDLTYLPLVQQRWFNVDLTDVALGDSSLGLPSFVFGYKNDAIGAFFDSGTSALLLGPLAFQTLVNVFTVNHAMLPGVKNGALFSGSGCVSDADMGSSLKDFPAVVLTFRAEKGSWTTSVQPSSYLLHTGGQYCLAIAGVPGVGAVLGDLHTLELRCGYVWLKVRLNKS
jgi:hypothetical protein